MLGFNGTYSECTPAVNKPINSESKCGAVAGDQLSEGCAFFEVGRVNLTWLSFRGVQSFTIIVRITVRIIILLRDLLHLSFLGGLAAESTLVVDSPSQDSIVECKSSAMHATNSDLDHTNNLG